MALFFFSLRKRVVKPLVFASLRRGWSSNFLSHPLIKQRVVQLISEKSDENHHNPLSGTHIVSRNNIVSRTTVTLSKHIGNIVAPWTNILWRLHC